MVATTVPYGAMELKLAARKFWVTGFLISLAIHAAILGAFHLSWFDGGTDIRHISFHEITLGPRAIMDPLVPGFVTPPPASGGNTHVRAERANPVAVPEEKADPEKTLATQNDMARAVDPVASGAGEGTGTEPGPIRIEQGDDQPVPFEAVEKLPEIVTRVTPAYPPMAVMGGMEGKVIVRILVGKDGHVRDAVVEHSTTECLNDAALDAARRFLFTPAYMNNGPVMVWITIPFTFRLK